MPGTRTAQSGVQRSNHKATTPIVGVPVQWSIILYHAEKNGVQSKPPNACACSLLFPTLEDSVADLVQRNFA